MSNLQTAFQHGKAFMAFLTCGDPDLATTAAAVRAAIAGGADLIEFGIPFSDPTAEGSVIQEANLRALTGGVTTDRIFTFVASLRAETDLPFVFMAYANVIFSYGTDRFLRRCREAGVDAILVPDLPFEEREEFLPACRACGVKLISTVTPTTRQRLASIAADAEGFLYIMASKDKSEAPASILTDPAEMIAVLRAHTELPCILGCGIATPAQAAAAAAAADGIVSRTALIHLFEEYGAEAPAQVEAFVASLKQAMA